MNTDEVKMKRIAEIEIEMGRKIEPNEVWPDLTYYCILTHAFSHSERIRGAKQEEPKNEVIYKESISDGRFIMSIGNEKKVLKELVATPTVDEMNEEWKEDSRNRFLLDILCDYQSKIK